MSSVTDAGNFKAKFDTAFAGVMEITGEGEHLVEKGAPEYRTLENHFYKAGSAVDVYSRKLSKGIDGATIEVGHEMLASIKRLTEIAMSVGATMPKAEMEDSVRAMERVLNAQPTANVA